MATRTRKREPEPQLETITLRGFSRVQLGEIDARGRTRLVADSGWVKNVITTTNSGGFNSYIAAKVGGGGTTVSGLQLATQTDAINASQASLSGEIATNLGRAALTTSLSTGSIATLSMTATWQSHGAAASTIGAIGVYDRASAGGQLAAGATYTTSQWASNQQVSATYEWRFGAST